MALRFRIPVRFADVDHAGIVYYPRFFHYFHQAFEEIFRQRFGGPKAYVELLDGDRVGLPAVGIEASFLKPLRFGDDVDIEVSLVRIGGTSVTLGYRAELEGQLCAQAKVTCCLIDLNTFEPIEVPAKLRNLFASL